MRAVSNALLNGLPSGIRFWRAPSRRVIAAASPGMTSPAGVGRTDERNLLRPGVPGRGTLGSWSELLQGRAGVDPLFLQVKQAGPSVYEAHTQPSRHDNQGARVINGKRLVQTATDIFGGLGRASRAGCRPAASALRSRG